MKAKEIRFSTQARLSIKRGVDKLANAVKVTLGPRGRVVAIEKHFAPPHITKDGVTVAKAIDLEDHFEDIGAQLVKEVASKTADDAGDGTTTATVLAQSIFSEGLKAVTAGFNPIELKRGLDHGYELLSEALKKLSKPIETSKEIAQVGTISANHDVSIGEMIAEAMEKVGNEGVIAVEESRTAETYLEVVQGMHFDRGYLSPYFVTDADTMEVDLQSPHVLVFQGKISNLREMLGILEAVLRTKRPLLIIAEDIEGDALSTLVLNRLKGVLAVAAVKGPDFGESGKESLKDVATIVGANLISETEGRSLATTQLEDLGTAARVRIDKDSTTIIDGGGSKESIKSRADSVRTQLEKADTISDEKAISARLARLVGGVAVIYVGAQTEMEMKEKKDRVDDALSSTRAATEEGILPGGGTALLRVASVLDGLKLNDDQQMGISILRRAIEAPLRQIAMNAGKEPSIVLNRVLTSSKSELGYNALTDTYEDLVAAGVIDPTKVVRLALANSISIASILMSTESAIAEAPERKKGDVTPIDRSELPEELR